MSAVDGRRSRAEDFFADARDDRSGPLAGIRVVDVTTVWSGPMASCLLADLGADVVRVEMPGSHAARVPPWIAGTTLSWFHESVNRNKRSLGLDLRAEGAREVFLQLVAGADVVVENFLPGTLDRWGVGFVDCRRVRPDVVMVSISGYGQYGPDAGRRGYDPVIQATGGWMDLNGTADGPPVKAPTFLVDDVVALHAALAALAALHHRDVAGEGQHVDVAMLDALLATSSGLPTLAAAGDPPRRRGAETESFVPSNTYRCRDGLVYLVAALDRQWRALCRTMGCAELGRAPGFARNDERRANREAVNAVVAEWCRDRDAEDVVGLAEAAGLAAGRVRGLAEVVQDPHVRQRMLHEVELSDGTRRAVVGPAAKFSRTPTRVRRSAPAPGADTREVLGGLGLAPGDVDSLHRRGVVG